VDMTLSIDDKNGLINSTFMKLSEP